MKEHFKTVLISIAFVLSLLVTGCSSTDIDTVDEQGVETQGAASSAPSAVEDRIYREAEKESVEREKEEKLKKRKSSDDDMERLD